jgi:LEA14-like dessication related protein
MSRDVGRVGPIVGVVVLLVVGVGAAYAAGLLGAPSVANVDNRFAGVNETTTLIETDLTISNPNPIGLDLGGLSIDYTVRLNDVSLANGSKQGVSVETGHSTLTFRTAMANERIPAWWVSHIRNGEHTTMRVETNVTSGVLGRSVEVTPVERPIETDILSAFNSTEPRPVDANSPLVSDPVLYVNETWGSWGDVSTSTTPMDLAFVVYNPKPATYAITEIRYAITMNGIDIGDGATSREYVIEPGTRETIEATAAIRNGRLDEWWVSHLENDQVTELRIEFSATVGLPTGETVDVPLDALTYTETIETDFFGNGAGSSEAATAGSTANDRSETDTGDDTATSTSTPTPTPTPTPDDGFPIGNETGTDTEVL